MGKIQYKYNSIIPEQTVHILKNLGENIELARKRRKITKKDFASRMLVSVPTLNRLELGDPSVGLGILVAALWSLGLQAQIAQLAHPDKDEIGKILDLRRLKRPLGNSLENDF